MPKDFNLTKLQLGKAVLIVVLVTITGVSGVEILKSDVLRGNSLVAIVIKGGVEVPMLNLTVAKLVFPSPNDGGIVKQVTAQPSSEVVVMVPLDLKAARESPRPKNVRAGSKVLSATLDYEDNDRLAEVGH